MFRNKQDAKKLADVLGYTFKDQGLLIQALTRISATNEHIQEEKIGHHQRLAFLGDKVLNAVISQIIFNQHSNWNKGRLTEATSNFISDKAIAKLARELSLGDFLIMGSGEEQNNMRENETALADAFEAVVGAVWLDSGKNYYVLRSFILKDYKPFGLKPDNDAEPVQDTTLGLGDYVESAIKIAAIIKFGLEAYNYLKENSAAPRSEQPKPITHLVSNTSKVSVSSSSISLSSSSSSIATCLSDTKSTTVDKPNSSFSSVSFCSSSSNIATGLSDTKSTTVDKPKPSSSFSNVSLGSSSSSSATSSLVTKSTTIDKQKPNSLFSSVSLSSSSLSSITTLSNITETAKEKEDEVYNPLCIIA